MKLRGLVWMLAFVVPIAAAMPAAAHAPSGAIFTTVADGSEVNFNIYPNKPSVYLDGGPGPGAPQTAAGLDDGTYVFMVTNPSARFCCRQIQRGAVNSTSRTESLLESSQRIANTPPATTSTMVRRRSN